MRPVLTSPTSRFTAVMLLALAAAPLTTWAEDGNVPAFQASGPLHYSCGGIGSDESTAMRGEMKNYPLSLLFARKDGEYLANVTVEIQGKTGAPAQFNAAGPVCLLKLPAGRYAVKTTTQGGAQQTKSVDVGRNGQTLDFRY